MKVSLNWIRKLTDVSIGLNQLLEAIGSQLGAVDDVEDLGATYKDVYVVRVVSVAKHPNAERLHVCYVDDGNVIRDIERNEHGLIQVICGAPNVRAEMLAVWLPPGSTVPETYGTKEPFVLSTRSMRGLESYGMLASPRELAFGDRHEGIFEVDEPSRPGEKFADIYELNDYIIDIENKMFTHRPDLFGMLGIAREIAGITGQQFTSPKWYSFIPDTPLTEEAREMPLLVDNQVPDLVPRFMAVVLTNVTPRLSPLLFQSYLLRVGVRTVNNIVDVTNYMMLLTGQPMHAYDYDKVKQIDNADAGEVLLRIRRPLEGEGIGLLNGKDVALKPNSIVIGTAKQPIGLGGIMGGGNTEVDSQTRTIILECATFDMYSTRRSSMAYGIFSDAVTRFTKGQSPLQNEYVLLKAVEVMKGMTGGQVASAIFDDRHLDGITASSDQVHQPIKIMIDFINSRLGATLSEEAITTLLRHVEFKVEQITKGQLLITAPFWRTDIEYAEDIVEEVGRLYGYDRLPSALPARDLTPPAPNALFATRTTIRNTLARAGATEVLSYSFVPAKLLERAGQDKAVAFQLSNALSPELQYYRLSLLPSLLEKIHPNIKAGYEELAVFELGRGHNKQAIDSEGLPQDTQSLGCVYAASAKIAAQQYGGAAFYQARLYLIHLLERFQLTNHLRFVPLAEADIQKDVWLQQVAAAFEPSRAVLIQDSKGVYYGVLGEFTAAILRAFKLPVFTAGFELATHIFEQAKPEAPYQPLSRYPSIEQDITLKVPTGLTYQRTYDFLQAQLDKHRPKHTHAAVSPVDIYQSADDTLYKHLTFRIKLASTERTLTDAEVAIVLDKMATAAKAELKADRI